MSDALLVVGSDFATIAAADAIADVSLIQFIVFCLRLKCKWTPKTNGTTNFSRNCFIIWQKVNKQANGNARRQQRRLFCLSLHLKSTEDFLFSLFILKRKTFYEFFTSSHSIENELHHRKCHLRRHCWCQFTWNGSSHLLSQRNRMQRNFPTGNNSFRSYTRRLAYAFCLVFSHSRLVDVFFRRLRRKNPQIINRNCWTSTFIIRDWHLISDDVIWMRFNNQSNPFVSLHHFRSIATHVFRSTHESHSNKPINRSHLIPLFVLYFRFVNMLSNLSSTE